MHWAYQDLLPSIRKQTKDSHSAVDILHDALLRFVMSSQLQTRLQPHAYLRVIVRNLLIDAHHESSRFVQLPTEYNWKNDNSYLQQNTAVSAEYMADLHQRLLVTQQIVQGLPPRCREVFWMFRIENLSQKEIAGRLGISLNMVERHIMRALLDLRRAKDLIG